LSNGTNLIQKATEHVNHEQVPVITVNQPLYAIAQKIQWTLPIKYGEGKFVVMLGRLHIDMSFLRLLGNWWEGSGWAEAITAANATMERRVDALLSVQKNEPIVIFIMSRYQANRNFFFPYKKLQTW